MHGLCINSRTIPDAAELATLRPSFLRALVYDLDHLPRLYATGVPLVLLLNNECQQVGWNWGGWDGAVAHVAEAAPGLVLAVECGNEFDLWWQHDEADVPPSFAADLANRAAVFLRPAGIKVLPTSVTSPRWPEYLREMVRLCRESIDYVNLHPYGQRPDGWGSPGWMHGDLSSALALAVSITGLRVAITEYGVKVGDAGGEDRQAAFLRATAEQLQAHKPWWSWFAWHDSLGTPDEQASGAGFGLRRSDGSERPSWGAFANLGESPGTEDPLARFILGFEKIARQYPQEVGAALEDERDGEAFGALARVQRTERGIMVWFKDAKSEPFFFKGLQAK